MRKGTPRPGPFVLAVAAAVAAAVALALGGCTAATSNVQGGPAWRASTPVPARSGATPARSVPAPHPAASVRSNEQRAETDAAAILASFAIPPSATRLPRAPGIGWGVLEHNPMVATSAPYYVDEAGLWRVPGAPRQVLAWAAAHLPHRFAADGGMTVNPSPDQVSLWMDTFQLPPVSGVLYSRQMTIEVVDAGRGQTDVRVDALVNWLPPRPASEVVPPAATLVTITEVLGSVEPGVKPPAPVTVTDTATVRELATAVDGLPLAPPDWGASCPADLGAYLEVAFQQRPGGPPLALAKADLTGCGLTYFSIGGKDQRALGTYGGAPAIAARLLRLAGLHWKLL
jgi:hypothetical protein